MKFGTAVALDPQRRCPDVVDFEERIRGRLIGQDEAIARVGRSLESYSAGMHNPERPVANTLLLGPTGVGKTHMVRMAALALHDDPNKFIRVDCAEFQQSHEVAKLIGSPPGYAGHKECNPVINDEKLDKVRSDKSKLALVLFDEIEKAHPNFWELLLGVLEHGHLTLGDGSEVDFRNTLIFMTSNIGSSEMEKESSGGLGFNTGVFSDKNLKQVSTNAARRKFSPEFFNRLDHVVTFHHLGKEELLKILNIELGVVQKRVLTCANEQKFVITITPKAEEYLLRVGTDKRYGARHLRRAIEQHVVQPISSLMLTGQVMLGDLVRVSCPDGTLQFHKIPAETIAQVPESEWSEFRHDD